MKSYFLTYASSEFERNARLLAASASRCGFSGVYCLGPEILAGTDFAERNKGILCEGRGGGYWLWKPYIIKKYVMKLKQDEVLFYSDAGRSSYYKFSRLPSKLLEQAIHNDKGFIPGVAIPHLGPIAKWTKRDCLQIMDADTPEIYNRTVVQATWSVWTKTEHAIEFLSKWLGYCEDPRCLTDTPNLLGKSNFQSFVDHRHDQSISSILVHKLGAPFLDFSGTLTQRALELRPTSELGTMFFKRAQNVDDLLNGTTPAILIREQLRLRSLQ